MKKLVSVLLCVAMLFSFFVVIASAEEAGDPANLSGGESILTMLLNLLKGVNWSEVLAILTTTIETLRRLFGS